MANSNPKADAQSIQPDYTPKNFFEIYVPAVLEIAADACKAIDKNLQFDLIGPGGGSWVVELGKLSCKPGQMAKADVRVEMKVADFVDIMYGRVDESTSGQMSVSGDIQLLGLFARLIGRSNE